MDKLVGTALLFAKLMVTPAGRGSRYGRASLSRKSKGEKGKPAESTMGEKKEGLRYDKD